MKTIISSLLALLIAVAGSGQIRSNIDVLHYKFEIGLSDANDTITGKAEVRLRFIHAAEMVAFDLVSITNGKGMKVLSVTEDDQPLEITQTPDQVKIHLRRKTNIGDTASFIVNYTGIPADGLIIAKNKFHNRTFFADNWPNRGHNWIPCHDDPSDKASVEFIVTAPNHYQVVANGIQIEETNINASMKVTHWKEDVELPTKVMAFGAADFAVNLSGMVECVPIYSWVYPEERASGFFDYAQAANILPFFISKVGPYGYKKLANVESKTRFGALENANSIFYSETSITGTRSDEDLLTHEIAHQWFGNMATEKTFAHLWLSEGFATYFTILYLENKYGIDTAAKMLQKDRKEVISYSKESNYPVVDTFNTDYMKLLNANSYQKGGWVLHMLRHELGDSIFWQAIRLYYLTYAGKNADTNDLREVFEKVSGKNLQRFFTQWLYISGQPKLSIKWKVLPKNKLQVTVTQLQKTLFNFPLELEIGDNNKKIERLRISKQQESFNIDVTGLVTDVLPDPNTNLLFEKVM